MNGLLSSPGRTALLLGGLGLLRAKTRKQADSAFGFGAQGLLGAAQANRQRRYEQPARDRAQEMHEATMAKYQQAMEGKDAFSKLIGSQGSPRLPDPVRGEMPISNTPIDASGLLGGEIGMKELATRAMAIPGYETMGAGLLSSVLDNEAKARDSEPRFGPYASYKDFAAAQRDLRKEATANLAPARGAMTQFGGVTNLVAERGGFEKLTGADDVALIKSFVKMITPKESVMSDDVRSVVTSSGVPGTIQSYLAAFEGKGQLGVDQRKAIYQTMTNLYGTVKQDYEQKKSGYLMDIDASGFDEGSVITPFELPTPYPVEIAEPPNPSDAPLANSDKADSILNQWGVVVK